MPRSFLFPVGEVWQPQMNFSSFGSLGCEIKGVSRDSNFLTIITTCFQQKTSLNKMMKNTLPTNTLVNATMTEQLLCLKETWIYNPLRTLLPSWSSKPPSKRRFWLACLVHHGQPPEISRDRHLPGRDDAGTAATTIETIWTTMMMTGSIDSNNQNSLVIGKSFVINQLKKKTWFGTFQHIRTKDIFLQENMTRLPHFSSWMVSPHVALVHKAAGLRWSVQERWC